MPEGDVWHGGIVTCCKYKCHRECLTRIFILLLNYIKPWIANLANIAASVFPICS